jgi:hypothetical protein
MKDGTADNGGAQGLVRTGELTDRPSPSLKELLIRVPQLLIFFTVVDFGVRAIFHPILRHAPPPSWPDSLVYGATYTVAFVIGNLLRNLNRRTAKSK